MDEYLERIQAQIAQGDEALRNLFAGLRRPDKGAVEWLGMGTIIYDIVFTRLEDILANALRAKGLAPLPAGPFARSALLKLAVERGVLPEELQKALDAYSSLPHFLSARHRIPGYHLEPGIIAAMGFALPKVWVPFREGILRLFPELQPRQR